jgi:hypothetical protein
VFLQPLAKKIKKEVGKNPETSNNTLEHSMWMFSCLRGFRRERVKVQEVCIMQNAGTNPSPTIDSWKTRIQDASAILNKTPEEVIEILSTLGVEELNGLEMLSDEEVTPFGDLRRAFCEESDVKIAQLRLAIKYLRGPKDADKASETLDPETAYLQQNYGIKGSRKLSDLDPTELIPIYNPAKANSKVTKALKKHFGNQNVIAFKPESKEVAVEETIDYIADLEQGYAEEEAIEVDGQLQRLYPVGVIPNEMVDEDPFFEGEPLKRGRSTVNRINWSNVSEDARQFCRLVVERDEIDPNDKLAVRNFMEIAEKGVEALRKVYSEVDLVYRELKEENNLPSLKLKLNEVQNGKTQNPFGVPRKY